MPGTAGDRVIDALRTLLDRRRDLEADTRPARVIGRNVDGSARLLRLDGECVSRGGQSGYVGETVTELPALFNRRGTSGVGVLGLSGSARILEIESIDPERPLAGATTIVSIIGRGFSEGTVFEFLRPESDEINDDITIDSKEFISSEQVDVTLTIAEDAEIFLVVGAIAFDDPEVPA